MVISSLMKQARATNLAGHSRTAIAFYISVALAGVQSKPRKSICPCRVIGYLNCYLVPRLVSKKIWQMVAKRQLRAGFFSRDEKSADQMNLKIEMPFENFLICVKQGERKHSCADG